MSRIGAGMSGANVRTSELVIGDIAHKGKPDAGNVTKPLHGPSDGLTRPLSGLRVTYGPSITRRSRRPAPVSPANKPADEPTPDGQGVRSVQRALDILSLLSEERPVVTIREIAAETGLAKTTVIRLVQTLENLGLLWSGHN